MTMSKLSTIRLSCFVLSPMVKLWKQFKSTPILKVPWNWKQAAITLQNVRSRLFSLGSFLCSFLGPNQFTQFLKCKYKTFSKKLTKLKDQKRSVLYINKPVHEIPQAKIFISAETYQMSRSTH